jgi:hypothetical protein
VNNDDAVLIMGHSLKVKAERKFPAFFVTKINLSYSTMHYGNDIYSSITNKTNNIIKTVRVQ